MVGAAPDGDVVRGHVWTHGHPPAGRILGAVADATEANGPRRREARLALGGGFGGWRRGVDACQDWNTHRTGLRMGIGSVCSRCRRHGFPPLRSERDERGRRWCAIAGRSALVRGLYSTTHPMGNMSCGHRRCAENSPLVSAPTVPTAVLPAAYSLSTNLPQVTAFGYSADLQPARHTISCQYRARQACGTQCGICGPSCR